MKTPQEKTPQKNYPYSDHLPQICGNLLIYNRLWQMRQTKAGCNNGFRLTETDKQYQRRLENQRKFLARTISSYFATPENDLLIIAMQESPRGTHEDQEIFRHLAAESGLSYKYEINEGGLSFLFIQKNPSAEIPPPKVIEVPGIAYDPKKFLIMEYKNQIYVNVHGDYQNPIWNLVNPITQYCLENGLAAPIFLGDFNREVKPAEDRNQALENISFHRVSAGKGAVVDNPGIPGPLLLPHLPSSFDLQYAAHAANKVIDGFIFPSFSTIPATAPPASFCESSAMPQGRADEDIDRIRAIQTHSYAYSSQQLFSPLDPTIKRRATFNSQPGTQEAYKKARGQLTEHTDKYIAHLEGSSNSVRQEKLEAVNALKTILDDNTLPDIVAVHKFNAQLFLSQTNKKDILQKHSLTPRLSTTFLMVCAGILLALGILPFIIAWGLSQAISKKGSFWKTHGHLYTEAAEETLRPIQRR